VGGKPLYAWSLEALRATPAIDQIVIAGPPGLTLQGEDVVVVEGGVERSHSVRNALQASSGDPVVVHDAARPLVTPALIAGCLRAVEHADAAIAAAPAVDTFKEAGQDRVVERTLNRSRLWAVQTPQVFTRAALTAALSQPDEVLARATDDASLVEAAGGRVVIVEAPRENLKVTTPVDLQLAELLLSRRAPAP
jgi:2-C-methyl-D-erythritol 4-phosphate cytidylyltransferase